MNLAELIRDAKDRIAEDSTAFFQDSTWKRWLNEAQRSVVRRTKILKRTATTTLVPSQSHYLLASDFWTIHLVTYNGEALRPLPANELAKRRIASSGTPSHYSLWGDSLNVHPAPSSPGELFVMYYAWPWPMEQDTDEPEVPEAFHGLLPTFAAYRAKMADQQPVEADRFYAEFHQGLEEMIEAFTEPQDQESVVRDVSDYGGVW